MSKIFQALQRANGPKSEIARLVLTSDPVVVDEQASSNELSAAQPSVDPAPADAVYTEPAVGEPANGHHDSLNNDSLGGDPSAPGPADLANAISQLQTVSIKPRTDLPLLPFSGKNTHAAEQYRIIRTRVVQHPGKPRMLVVSSAESGDGKTITAVNLAGVLALNRELRILLIDADLHRSSLARYLSVNPSPGLADMLTGEKDPSEAIVQLDIYPNLYFLPGGGNERRGSAELLNSPAWSETAAMLRQYFDYIVVDAPPAGAVADFDLIQAACDGVVLVIRQDHTKRPLAYRMLNAIPREKLVGVIMNCVERWSFGQKLGYYNHYYYSKYYSKSEE